MAQHMRHPIDACTRPGALDEAQGTLLVVDDTPETLTILRKWLNDHRYRVAVARNGQLALERVKRIHPDLILLDVLMPGMDGFEVCRLFKQDPMTRKIPVIFMTALDSAENKVKGFQAGAEDYITKPLNMDEVLARVRTHITLHKVQQTLQSRNAELQAALERERRMHEDLRVNLSLALPHELLTPLTGILGHCELLRKQLKESQGLDEYVTGIYDGGLRLHHLIKNALLYARLRILHYLPDPERTEREEQCISIKERLERIALQKAEHFHRQRDLLLELQNIRLRVSPDNFDKIFEEVLDNAFKFSEAGTSVRVTAISDEKHRCLLTVSDRGRGMTREQIARIEAYTQFKREQYEQQGLGLGGIVASLLTLWEGGNLSISSQPQHGTTVRIRFRILSRA